MLSVEGEKPRCCNGCEGSVATRVLNLLRVLIFVASFYMSDFEKRSEVFCWGFVWYMCEIPLPHLSFYLTVIKG